MGRGNVSVSGEHECLYYIDNEYIHAYRRYANCDANEDEYKFLKDLSTEELRDDWEFDYSLSAENWEDILRLLREGFCEKFSSFFGCDNWITDTRRAILENGLYYIAIEDNERSMAVELIQKENWEYPLDALQARHFPSYQEGLLSVLLSQFEYVSAYDTPWTCNIIHRHKMSA